MGVDACVKTRRPAEGSQEAVYQVRLPLSKRTIDLVAGLIRKRRKELGSRWRKLVPRAPRRSLCSPYSATTSALPT